MQTVTITYGDVCENHVGMEKTGSLSEHGLSYETLVNVQKAYNELGKETELINLHEYTEEEVEEAYILVIRKAVDTADDFLTEQLGLTWDTKAKMYGRVVNKKARHNLCYAETAHKADYENGKGTIVAFESVPILTAVKTEIEALINVDLVAEGNFYYDTSKCGIGWHFDNERRIVVAVRLGASMPLHFQWYRNCNRIGEQFKTVLNHGDMYFMSAKAVGFDGKKRKIATLRHAAGAAKFTM